MLTDSIQVIDQCGLSRDLELLDAGDLTEVGEKGLTLRYAMHACANGQRLKLHTLQVAGKRCVHREASRNLH